LNYNAAGSKCWNGETHIGNMVDENTEYCDKYGRLYDWATAMGIDIIYNSTLYSAPAKHKGVCPAGWHIPTNAEWDELTLSADNNTTGGFSLTAGTKLKAKSGWDQYVGAPAGTDEFGFAALPGGQGSVSDDYNNYYFGNLGTHGNWWSATERDVYSGAYVGDLAYRVNLWNGGEIFGSPDSVKKGKIFYSVRCLKN
jgi:uncharacterized protein (TIGR02145 family)